MAAVSFFCELFSALVLAVDAATYYIGSQAGKGVIGLPPREECVTNKRIVGPYCGLYSSDQTMTIGT